MARPGKHNVRRRRSREGMRSSTWPFGLLSSRSTVPAAMTESTLTRCTGLSQAQGRWADWAFARTAAPHTFMSISREWHRLRPLTGVLLLLVLIVLMLLLLVGLLLLLLMISLLLLLLLLTILVRHNRSLRRNLARSQRSCWPRDLRQI